MSSEKGLAQTKAAADGSVAKAQDDIKAEDHIEDWKAQQQETQNAADAATGPSSSPHQVKGCLYNPGQDSVVAA